MGLLILLFGSFSLFGACTGISFRSEDGYCLLARTVEWGDGMLPSEYVILPRGEKQTYGTSFANG